MVLEVIPIVDDRYRRTRSQGQRIRSGDNIQRNKGEQKGRNKGANNATEVAEVLHDRSPSPYLGDAI